MKKVLVFTSNIGGGHSSASAAIKDILASAYDIQIVNFVDLIASCTDPVRLVTFGHKNLEDGFNVVARNQWNRFANSISAFALKYLCLKCIRNKLAKNLVAFLNEHKPDIVISVIGFVNGSIAIATDQLKIPFIIVSTDLDQVYSMNGLKNMRSFDEKRNFPFVRCVVALDHFEIQKTMPIFSLSKGQILPLGFPLRAQFFEKKAVESLKKKWNIPDKKQVVMAMMGKLGLTHLYDIAKALSKIKKPIHLCACIGTSGSLKEKLLKIEEKDGFSMSIIEYTDRISDLMALSDLIIIKPGSTGFVEAATMNKPILIDAICCEKPLKVERFNCDFSYNNDLGLIITKLEDLEDLLTKLSEKKTALNFFPKNFIENMQSLVASLV
jgi:processive 1,2-diacylglycerol beta-glucosyltransferase